jgi:CheY-like chemotaxis protein
VVKESLKLLAASLPSNIEMHQDIAAEESKILGDPTHISQIILNLCTNAYHAMMETGGILRVSLTEIDLTGEETWQDFPLAPGRYLRLSVSDTGKGMSPEVQAQIFEPYYTTKKIGEGTGLGLAVVHGIVTSCNGAIRVSSSPGQGAIFQVYLPLLEGNGSPPDGVLLTEILPRGTERILLVDDEEPVLESTRRTLEYLGYQVTPQLSSTKALELFTNNPHRFDLVITDVTMPNLTGDHLAGNLRRIRPDIPVILCTGFSSMVDEARAKELQAYALLFKPLLRHDLAHMVRSALDSRKHRAGI